MKTTTEKNQMSRKLTILLSLLIVTFILLGTGAVFLYHQLSSSKTEIAIDEIEVVPGPGSILENTNGGPSKILLENIQIEKTVSDWQYQEIFPPYLTVKPGDPILLMTLLIQNQHPEYQIIGISAAGYDASGAVVSLTIDDSLHAMSWASLQYQEIGKVTLHLSFSNKIKSIKISGNNYQHPVP